MFLILYIVLYRVVHCLFVEKTMCVRPPQLKGFILWTHYPISAKFATVAPLQPRFQFVQIWAGAASWPQKQQRRTAPRGACVSGWCPSASHRTASDGMTQIHSLSVGGTFSPRMSPELLGAKNKWLTCDALARIFVCYCVSFYCMVLYWGMRGGTFQTVFERNYSFKLASLFFLCWYLKGKSRLSAGC